MSVLRAVHLGACTFWVYVSFPCYRPPAGKSDQQGPSWLSWARVFRAHSLPAYNGHFHFSLPDHSFSSHLSLTGILECKTRVANRKIRQIWRTNKQKYVYYVYTPTHTHTCTQMELNKIHLRNAKSTGLRPSSERELPFFREIPWYVYWSAQDGPREFGLNEESQWHS